MEYFRTRFEKITNEDNSVKEIFIAVKLFDNGDVWEQGYWLSDIEVTAVVADEEAALPAIIDRVALMGKAALDRYKSSVEPEILN